MKRWFSNLGAATSALLCVAVCVLWVRGRTGFDEVSWTYDRYMSDGGAASNQVYITSDHQLWLNINWGHVGPYNGNLVWGYYINADQSGGRPRLSFRHGSYGAMKTLAFAKANINEGAAFGALRWQSASRTKAKEGDDFRTIRVGISHWLLGLLLLVPSMLWLNHFHAPPRQFSLRELFVAVTIVAALLGIAVWLNA
jgi:hypothetical protein